MKAATIARYGSPGVIEVRDVPAPVPGPDEVLVRVHAATVNRSDCGELLHPTVIRSLILSLVRPDVACNKFAIPAGGFYTSSDQRALVSKVARPSI